MVPQPLMAAPGKKGRFLAESQAGLTRYYARSGAITVIEGAHTGQFARGDLDLYRDWMQVSNDVLRDYVAREEMFMMSAVGGPKALQMAELAAEQGRKMVMVAPSAFTGGETGVLQDVSGALDKLGAIAEVIPVYGFYLQPALSNIILPKGLWQGMFEFAYGAKAAPFHRGYTNVVMQAALESDRLSELVMSTGNDDYIVGDFIQRWGNAPSNVQMQYGLLGHFAADTESANGLVAVLKWYRDQPDVPNVVSPEIGTAKFPDLDFTAVMRHFKNDTNHPAYAFAEKAVQHGIRKISIVELAADVTSMNRALFDDMDLPGSPPFDNSVYGVQWRLAQLGVVPSSFGIHWPAFGDRLEVGRPGLEKEISNAYAMRPYLCDRPVTGQ